MKNALHAVVGAFVLGLIAGVSVTQATDSPASVASIHGTRIKKTIFAEPHTACVLAVDTQLVPHNEANWNRDLRIAPGRHYITVRYYYRANMARTTFILETKPGAKYAVQFNHKAKWADLWIADLASGRPVTKVARVVPKYDKRRDQALFGWYAEGGSVENLMNQGTGLQTHADTPEYVVYGRNPGVDSLKEEALTKLSPTDANVYHPELLDTGPNDEGVVSIGPLQEKDDPAAPLNQPAKPK